MSSYATNRFAGDGVTTAYAINFIGGYIAREHVKAYREDNITKERTAVPILPGQFVGPYQLNGFAPTPVGQTFVLHRSTPAGPLVSFANGSHFTAVSLDIVARQGLFLAAESLDNAGTATGGGGGGGGVPDEDWEAALAEVRAALAEVRALAAQVDGQVSTVTTAAADAIAAALAADQSRIAASSSASAASTSAGSASASASNASSSASNASASASNASSSASAASTSAMAAGASATLAGGYRDTANAHRADAEAAAAAALAAAESAGGRQEALNAMASARIAELAAVAAANAGGGGGDFDPADFVSTTGNQSVHGVKSFDDPRGPSVQVQDYHALALLRSTVLRGGPGAGGQAVSVGWTGDSGNPGYAVSTDGVAHGRLLTWGVRFYGGPEIFGLGCGGVGLSPTPTQRLGLNTANTGIEFWQNDWGREAVICTDRTDLLGALAFAQNTTANAILRGSTLNGSFLKPAGADSGQLQADTLTSGTWKCLGYAPAGASTLWVRVA